MLLAPGGAIVKKNNTCKKVAGVQNKKNPKFLYIQVLSEGHLTSTLITNHHGSVSRALVLYPNRSWFNSRLGQILPRHSSQHICPYSYQFFIT